MTNSQARRLVVGSNDLQTRRPDIADSWHPNNAITPSQIAYCSAKKALWLCKKSHVWEASVASRTRMGSGCPYCGGYKAIPGENDLATLHPLLILEWSTSNTRPPQEYLPKSDKKVWWICTREHEWQATVSNRTARNPTGCPFCVDRHFPFIERALADAVTSLGLIVMPHFDTGLVGLRGQKVVVDLYIPELNLCVEHDGRVYHQARVEADTRKSVTLLAGGFNLIRVREHGLVLLDIPGVTETSLRWTRDRKLILEAIQTSIAPYR